jgi:hypothetical protein
LAIVGRRPEPPSVRQLLGEFRGFRMSYWGVFGGFNVLAASWVYRLYDGLALAGIAGWGVWLWRRRGGWRRPETGLLLALVAWILIVLVALIRWTSQTYASQGRLIFPAIAALAILLAYGLAGWLPRRWQARGLAGVSAGMLILAAALPFSVIAPAYARPPLLSADQIPPTAQRADVIHAATLRLLAYELPKEPVRPGGYAAITVYWQAVAPTDQDLSVFVHLLELGGKSAGQIGTYPGLGAYPTSLLRPGDIVRDTYQVPVVVSATAPSLLWVDVGLYRYQKEGGEVGLSAADSTGQPASGIIGMVRLLPHHPPPYKISHPVRFDLDGQAVLLGYDLQKPGFYRPGDTLELTLYWQAQARMAGDYHVFVHLVGPDGQTAAQGDKAPLDGAWPTWAWEPGYPVRDSYPIRLPQTLAPGIYELRVGLYRVSDGRRVPVQGPESHTRDSAIILSQVEIR